jgi:type I restriction enzyme M protein
LTNLVNIFNSPALDFSKNRADHDDILGDAYEYLMQHFAKDSGKSKGQFYTPSEISRILAKVIGISPQNSVAATTVYDPTCGSGSLLLKVAAEAGKYITLEGQEMDVTTAGLARMNMILHNFPTANIVQGNTLASPKFKDDKNLKTYDYVVANPPFSDKTWSTGINPANDEFQRFAWGEPPAKQGDYAYLLHIIRSMKSTGKGACILPHGVLFRGNAEAVIRKQLILSGYLKGVIGLPANLFYGTGIPACILVLDKENAVGRKGIFMIDASKGFLKDGNKNRLREQDIHRIVDAFSKMEPIEKFARMVPLEEIADPKNDYNLNIPRYIDATEKEDIQDINAHLNGGIPLADIDEMQAYWAVLPSLRNTLFEDSQRADYLAAKVSVADIKPVIHQNVAFQAVQQENTLVYEAWKNRILPLLTDFDKDAHPKALITELSESLLMVFKSAKLVNAYEIYQHLMNYWNETLQDDAYLIAADGWKAETYRIKEEVKAGKDKGKQKDKGWTCDLLPKPFIVAKYFQQEQTHLEAKQAELETLLAQIAELEEEHGSTGSPQGNGEEGAFAELDKINKAEINKRLKDIKGDKSLAHEIEILKKWLALDEQQSTCKTDIKKLDDNLDKLAYEKYPTLSEADIKNIVIHLKWLPAIQSAVKTEMERVSQQLTGRIKELIARYETPMPVLLQEVRELEEKVNAHLQKMGFVWK